MIMPILITFGILFWIRGLVLLNILKFSSLALMRQLESTIALVLTFILMIGTLMRMLLWRMSGADFMLRKLAQLDLFLSLRSQILGVGVVGVVVRL